MLKEGQRFCDLCDERIIKGATYQRNRMAAHAANLLTIAGAPDLIQTWTTHPDGTISMDICTTCVLSMDVVSGKNEMN